MNELGDIYHYIPRIPPSLVEVARWTWSCRVTNTRCSICKLNAIIRTDIRVGVRPTVRLSLSGPPY